MVIGRWIITLTAAGALAGCSEKPPETHRLHRAVLYFDGEDRFQMDYEGTGYCQRSGEGIGGKVYFRAMHLKSGREKDVQNDKWTDASFEGTYLLSGEENQHVSLTLKVTTKVPFQIRLMGVVEDHSKESSKEIVRDYPAGDHEFAVEGTIAERYEKSSS